eukprot:6182833-Pleurochrysis_carterae.AAC.4
MVQAVCPKRQICTQRFSLHSSPQYLEPRSRTAPSFDVCQPDERVVLHASQRLASPCAIPAARQVTEIRSSQYTRKRGRQSSECRGQNYF